MIGRATMNGIYGNSMPAQASFVHRVYGQSDGQKGRLEDVCADFEAIFVGYMMKALRRTIPEKGFHTAPGRDIYTLMFDQKVAEDLSARGGGIGLRSILLRQLGAGETKVTAKGDGAAAVSMPSAGDMSRQTEPHHGET